MLSYLWALQRYFFEAFIRRWIPAHWASSSQQVSLARRAHSWRVGNRCLQIKAKRRLGRLRQLRQAEWDRQAGCISSSMCHDHSTLGSICKEQEMLAHWMCTRCRLKCHMGTYWKKKRGPLVEQVCTNTGICAVRNSRMTFPGQGHVHVIGNGDCQGCSTVLCKFDFVLKNKWWLGAGNVWIQWDIHIDVSSSSLRQLRYIWWRKAKL